MILLACLVSASIAQVPSLEKRFLVEYRVEERCHECPWWFALACPQDQPECNVPWKSKDYYEWFASQEDALAFINAGFQHPTPPCRPEQPCQPREQVQAAPHLPPRLRRPVHDLPPALVGVYEIGREVPIGVRAVRDAPGGPQTERVVFFLAPVVPKK